MECNKFHKIQFPSEFSAELVWVNLKAVKFLKITIENSTGFREGDTRGEFCVHKCPKGRLVFAKEKKKNEEK